MANAYDTWGGYWIVAPGAYSPKVFIEHTRRDVQAAQVFIYDPEDSGSRMEAIAAANAQADAYNALNDPAQVPLRK